MSDWQVIVDGDLLYSLMDLIDLDENPEFLEEKCKCRIRFGLNCPCGLVQTRHRWSTVRRKLRKAIRDNKEYWPDLVASWNIKPTPPPNRILREDQTE